MPYIIALLVACACCFVYYCLFLLTYILVDVQGLKNAPVGVFVVNNATNAGLMAVRILGLGDNNLQLRLAHSPLFLYVDVCVCLQNERRESIVLFIYSLILM